jgi:hypothetical protein
MSNIDSDNVCRHPAVALLLRDFCLDIRIIECAGDEKKTMFGIHLYSKKRVLIAEDSCGD